ncbi:response regulator transcription factor [Sporomusa aerivorans]|uniref:response regulator transcription factor n=1 Tax=Sporomusa aerivorans TaxID=204936 RepID=UPI00352B2DB4
MADKILVVDDDPVLCELISAYLKNDGFDVVVASSGQQALHLLSTATYDLLLLDVVLPDTDGNQLAQQMRTLTNIPILFISTRDSEVDKAIGLGVGGDDYLTKPLSRIELVARIKAHLRRYRQIQTKPFDSVSTSVGPIRIDISQRRIWIHDKEVTLTTREFNLLRVFTQNPGQVLTKEQLFELVWGDEFFDDNTLMVAVRRLRSKIESNPTEPKLIETVWGVGYRLSLKKSC